MTSFWWSLPLTLCAFFSARWVAKKINSPLCNPMLIALLLIIAVLLLGDLSYTNYFSGNALLNNLLQPAIVALALPLYQQLPQIRHHWISIIILCFVGSLTAMITGTVIALWMGAPLDIAASILPKSITIPLAMTVTQSLHGIPAITAVCVLLVGMMGAILGYTLINLLKINSKAARGLTMGTVSHALGTARCLEVDVQEGAFSSLALVFCGIITSLLAPLVFPLLLSLG